MGFDPLISLFQYCFASHASVILSFGMYTDYDVPDLDTSYTKMCVSLLSMNPPWRSMASGFNRSIGWVYDQRISFTNLHATRTQSF